MLGATMAMLTPISNSTDDQFDERKAAIIFPNW